MRNWLLVSLLVLCSWGVRAMPTSLVIASGEIGGVYFQMAGEFCRLVNLQPQGVSCSVLPTDGSLENLSLLADGGADMALVQGDMLLAAYRGEGRFAGTAQPDLRAIMATHAQPLTLIVRQDWSGGLAALQGRAVYLGAPLSGSRATASHLLALSGLLGQWQEPFPADPQAALCQGQIDMIALLSGHPSRFVVELARRCPIRFLPFSADTITAYVAMHPEYRISQIPGRLYPNLLAPVSTVATPAILVARKEISAKIIQQLLTAFWNNRSQFNKNVSAYANLFRYPEHMLKPAQLIPVHPAAAKTLSTLKYDAVMTLPNN